MSCHGQKKVPWSEEHQETGARRLLRYATSPAGLRRKASTVGARDLLVGIAAIADDYSGCRYPFLGNALNIAPQTKFASRQSKIGSNFPGFKIQVPSGFSNGNCRKMSPCGPDRAVVAGTGGSGRASALPPPPPPAMASLTGRRLLVGALPGVPFAAFVGGSLHPRL